MSPERPADQPSVADVGEFGVIAGITGRLAQPSSTLLGPGDDAAVVAAADGRVVASTDVLVEHVHFRLDWSSPEQVGRKAIVVNLADLAAMGATPVAVLVGLACPPTTPAAVLTDIGKGMAAAAGAAGAGLVGGDLVGGPQLVISVTALGDLGGRAPVTRAGARPGDVVALAGKVGWSAAGLATLSRGFRSPVTVVNAHRVPEPPLAEGPVAADAGATAMIDVSDGLLADLAHVAAASTVAIDVRSAALDLPQRLVDVATALGADPLRWLLTGGEDHALAATFPDRSAVPDGWRVIGVVREGSGVIVDGEAYDGATGWQHWQR